MRNILFILMLFFCFKAEAQYRIFGTDGRTLRSHPFVFLGTGGTDSVGRIDSLKINWFKPVKPGEYTTAGAPAAGAFAGFIIWNTDSVKHQYSNGTNWINFGSGAGAGGGSYLFNSPLSESGGSVSISNAAADGSTKGAASFVANDFDASSGNIGIDYTNAQMATGSLNGFMSATTQTIGGAKTWSGNAVFNGAASVQVGGTVNGVLNIASSAASVRGSIDLNSNNPTLNSATGSWQFRSAGATVGLYNATGWFFGGGTTPANAYVGILAGTTSLSVMQWNSGPLKTSKCVGCWGFLTDKLYFTITTGTAEKEVALWDAAGTSGRVPFATTNNRLLDDGGFLWNNTTKVLSVQSGTTSAMAKVGGPIWNSAANNLTSTTSETDLYSFTTPATTLGADGDWLEYEVDGVINPDAVGGGATKTIRVYWAGTEVSEMTSTSTTAQYYKVLVRVVRTSSSNARVMVSVIGGGVAFDGTNPALTNVTTTFSNTNILKITGQTTGSTDIVAVQYGTIKYWPQSL